MKSLKESLISSCYSPKNIVEPSADWFKERNKRKEELRKKKTYQGCGF